MNFEISELGNRIVIKTIKKNETVKITHMRYNDAIKCILRIHENGWCVEKKGYISDYRIKAVIQ